MGIKSKQNEMVTILEETVIDNKKAEKGKGKKEKYMRIKNSNENFQMEALI